VTYIGAYIKQTGASCITCQENRIINSGDMLIGLTIYYWDIDAANLLMPN